MPRKPNFDKDDLITRARDLFWRQGWAGTSMKDIEKTLALNPGSIYAAFGSKEELYSLALDKYAADGAAKLNRMTEEGGPLVALQTYPRSTLKNENATACACMLAKTCMELSPQNHPLAAKAEAQLRIMEGRFEALFLAAQSNGQISVDHNPKHLAQRYQSDLLGLRLSAERADFDAIKVADNIAEGLAQL
jgi:AcrR family transcriptional regulator